MCGYLRVGRFGSCCRAKFRKTVSQTLPPRGRAPVFSRMLLALELLNQAMDASDENICHSLRTACAVIYACGLREYQAHRSQAHFVLPETLCELRGRIDEALMDEIIAIQAAAAMEEGLVSPAHLVINSFPADQGTYRLACPRGTAHEESGLIA